MFLGSNCIFQRSSQRPLSYHRFERGLDGTYGLKQYSFPYPGFSLIFLKFFAYSANVHKKSEM